MPRYINALERKNMVLNLVYVIIIYFPYKLSHIRKIEAFNF